MNIADLITEFGAYYLNHGQNLKDLRKQLFQKSETELMFTRQDTEQTVLRGAEPRISRVLQPFQKIWSPTGTATWKAVDIPLFKMKIDFEDYPDELEASWLAFLADKDLDRKHWPIVRYVIEELIMPQQEEDLEENEIYSGEFVAPAVPGTAGAAGEAMDGIKKIINDWIDAGRTSTIATGALEADPVDFVTQLEEWCKSIDQKYWKTKFDLGLNPQLYRRFMDGMQIKYNQYYKQKDDIVSVNGFPITLSSNASMIGSDKVFMAPKWNMVSAVKKPANQKTMEVESVDRKVKCFTDFWRGVGFWIPELIFTNDLDLSA